MKLLTYNVHDILRVKTNINIVPSSFKVEDSSIKPDLMIYLGDFSFNPSKIKHDYIYYEHRRQLIFKTKFLLEDLQGKTRMMYTSPRWKLFKKIRRPIAELISALIQIKLLQKGYSLIHAACLEKDGKAFLIVAPPETGKTSCVLSLVKEGFGYLADDVCIIDGTHAYSWPKPLTLHPGHIKAYKVKINLREKVELLVRERLSTLPFIKLAEEMRIQPKRIFKEDQIIKGKTRIEKIFFLKLGGGGISEIDKDLAIRITMVCNELCPLRINVDYILNYAYKYPRLLDLKALADLQYAILAKAIKQADCYEVSAKDRRFDKYIKRII